MAGPADVGVIYIGGTGRSGSTVLARQLAQLDGAVSAGELRYIWTRGVADNHLCGCGVPFRDCEFWSEVLSRAYGADPAARIERADQAARSDSVDRIRHIPAVTGGRLCRAPFRATLDSYAELIRPLYRALLDVSQGSVIIDSSKDPSYAVALRSIDGIDVSLVHLVRDSRAVAHSWTRRKVRPEIHWQVEFMQTLAPRTSATRWLEYNLIFEALHRLPASSIRLRYEDFATDPQAAIERIARLSKGRLTTRRSPAPFVHNISGNPIRFEAVPEPVRVDDEWRTAMTRADRRTVTAITAPLLGAYHYPIRAGSR